MSKTIIRIRSSAGTFKVMIETIDITLQDFKAIVSKQLSIPLESLTLSKDMAGNEIYADNLSKLVDLNIKNGDIVFVVGRLEREIVTKSYVSEDGNVVNAGKEVFKVQASYTTLDAPTIGQREEKQISNKPIEESTKQQAKAEIVHPPVEQDDEQFHDFLEYEEHEDIRPADQPRTMRLVDDDVQTFPHQVDTLDEEVLRAAFAGMIHDDAFLQTTINHQRPKATSRIRDGFGQRHGPMRALQPPSSGVVPDHPPRKAARRTEKKSNVNAAEFGLSEDELAQQIRMFEAMKASNSKTVIDLTESPPVKTPIIRDDGIRIRGTEEPSAKANKQENSIRKVDLKDRKIVEKPSSRVMKAMDDARTRQQLQEDEKLARMLHEQVHQDQVEDTLARAFQVYDRVVAEETENNPDHVFYDEDDELFARALQESLNHAES